MGLSKRRREKSSCSRPSTSTLPVSRWEKVLYKRQSFPDNYTDRNQFLDQLRTNVNVVNYSLSEAVRGGATVMVQADLVILYIALFEFTRLDWFGPVHLLLALGLAIILLLLCLFLVPRSDRLAWNWDWSEHWPTLLTILAFGYAFTPVIRTLTTSISTDSIYASAIFLFLASLVVHDFGLGEAPIASTPLSLNLCLSASVFLISRLNSDPLAFLLLSLSLIFFCFWPPLRNALLSHHPSLVFPLFFPLSVISIVSLAILPSPAFPILHTLLHFFIVLFCPWLLVRMQRLKSTIHGPWDEATLRASMG